MSKKPYIVTDADKAAIFQTAKNLGLDPNSLGAVLQQESGMNPNIWGGQGGNYYGAIQFGKTERGEAGLDPSKIGNYTLAEQMPHVEKWLRGRGYQPGMGVEKVYATILGGNPDADIYAKDSFGTSVADSIKRFKPGGVHYATAQTKLGDVSVVGQQQPGTATNKTQSNLGNNFPTQFINQYFFGSTSNNKKENKPESLVEQLQKQLFNQMMGGQQQKSFASRLLDSMKNSPYGGYLNPTNAMSSLEDYYNRLF